MNSIPLYLPVAFAAIVILSAWALFRAARWHRGVIIAVVAWILLQTATSLTAFYTDFRSLPPRIALLVVPPMVVLVVLLTTTKGRSLLDRFDTARLTLLHAVRIPVEFVLLGLALSGAAPKLITFEGINFDIHSGLSAPIVYWLVFIRKKMGRTGFLIWNLCCLLLLVNVVAHAILATPAPFQQFAFGQPLTAVGYFPFTLLPGFVVPAVAFAHAVTIRSLLRDRVRRAAPRYNLPLQG